MAMPTELRPDILKAWHEMAMQYDEYLSSYPEKSSRWQENDSKSILSSDQHTRLSSFTRKMNVIVISGIWCGDCSAQGPMLAAISSGSSHIDLRWLEKDVAIKLSNQVKINAGNRVPTVLFMAEDYELVQVYGDRTLTRYRAIAERQLGASCDVPGASIPEDEFRQTQQEWLDEFERVQLLLRLSTRLRQKHGD